MPTARIRRWRKEHPNLIAFLLVVIVFLYTTARFTSVVDQRNEDSQKRFRAFCGLVYLFDQSIKLRGTTDLGALQPPYDQWKRDVEATNCPKKPDLPIPAAKKTQP
jgi:hypothetical protein